MSNTNHPAFKHLYCLYTPKNSWYYTFGVAKEDFIGYKKVYQYNNKTAFFDSPVLATLLIPRGTIVGVDGWESNHYGKSVGKCRAQEAYVLDLTWGRKKFLSACASRDSRFIYALDQAVKPKRAFSQKSTPCNSGIHFFMEINQAKRW